MSDHDPVAAETDADATDAPSSSPAKPRGPARVLVAKGRMARPRLVELAGSRASILSRPAEEEGTNEDALLVQETPRGVFLGVADGVGGMPHGERASRLALEAFSRSVAHEDWPVRGMDAAQASVRRLGGACTTVVAAEVVRDRVRFVHCGDAAGMVIGARGHLRLETVPHSPTGFAIAGGLMDEDEARASESRHLVNNLLGTRPLRYEITGPTKLMKRDTVLLASDGLFDNLSFGEIVERVRLRPIERAMKALTELCRERMESGDEGTKPDDLTIVLWRRA